MGALIVLESFHHGNTAKIAAEIASVLGANITTSRGFDSGAVYDLIGFGSGIYDQQHHKALLEMIDRSAFPEGQKVFIFSTSGVSREKVLKTRIRDPHKTLREKLTEKQCVIVGEFNCHGWNTNSVLKWLGGINKGRPNANDLRDAKIFAESL